MAGLRDIRRKARGVVHERMSDPVIYLSSADATPLVVNARVHTRTTEIDVGDGAGPGFAQLLDTTPKIRFLRSEVSKPNAKTGFVLVSADEGYLIQHVRPPYGITIDAEVSDLDAARLAEWWKPEYAELLA